MESFQSFHPQVAACRPEALLECTCDGGARLAFALIKPLWRDSFFYTVGKDSETDKRRLYLRAAHRPVKGSG